MNSPDSPSRNSTKLGHLVLAKARSCLALSDKTVLRTGYGIFWLPNDVRWNIAPNNDIVMLYNNPFNGTLDGSITPNDALRNPFPNGLLPLPAGAPNVQQLF